MTCRLARFWKHLGSLLLAVAICTGGWLHAAEEDAPRAKLPLNDLTLADAEGRDVALASLAGERGLVLVFVGAECPLVRAYLPRLIELQGKLKQLGFGLVAVDANRQDTPEKVSALAGEFALSFPVLIDAEQRLADALDAQRTPEAFVLDAQGAVRYRGQIDDQYGLGYQRAAPRQRYLQNAVESLAAARPVETPVTQAVGCVIGRVHRAGAADAPAAAVTYSNQIVRLLNKNCVACHREGDIAPFALTDYDAAAAWAESCVEAIDDGRMPPWLASPEHGSFTNELRLSDEEKRLFRQWVAAGCPEGDRDRLPTAAEHVVRDESFMPDLVYPLSDRPFNVPASGVVDYQYFAIDPGWKEDKWIRRAEIYPGEPSVVHHVLLFVERPGVRYPGIYPGELIGGFVPGRRGASLPEGTAYHIPAGSRIVAQMHYTPNGIARRDLTHVGFQFADPASVHRVASARRAINVMFQIPPHAAEYEATARYEFPREAVLLSMTPHMHVRGKSFRYDAIFPDGRRQTLLDVPRWDFNWQMDYALTEPLTVPAKTVIECTAVYDNSKDNPANPDPSKWVTFGEQTWQEMLIGFFIAVEPLDRSKTTPGELADAVDDLVQQARRPRRGERRGERALDVTRESLDVVRTAGELAGIREAREVSELEHIISGALNELKKQQLAGEQSGDQATRDNSVGFLLNSTSVLRSLTKRTPTRAIQVEPVAWPLDKQR